MIEEHPCPTEASPVGIDGPLAISDLAKTEKACAILLSKYPAISVLIPSTDMGKISVPSHI